ncbi:MAG TPA: glycosyltransferase family 4 protein [Spongiibacteraceae bacterium]|nr:glycosyltransferase family 4 protein [Spongiibacteraceae bacterium]
MKLAASAKTILHVIDTTGPGGAETVFIQLADQLRQRGYRSVVVIRGPGWVCEQLLARGIKPYIIAAKGSFNWRFLRALVRLIRREQVDVIQSHLLGSNVYCAMAGLLTRKPVIATFHGMVDVGPRERFRSLKLWLMNRGVMQFVAVSKNLRSAIHREGLLDPGKCTIIYNGIDLSRYGSTQQRDLRNKLGLGDEALLIGSLGNIRPAKGYDLLIRAARRVVDIFPQAHFVIAGEPKSSLQRQLDELCRQEGVTDNVHFVGFCSDSAAFLAQLDYFLLSSISEGLSIATVEALATGLPAVVTRCGGPEEILSADRDGLMVTIDAEAIAAGVIQLLSDAALANRLARSGLQTVRERFDVGVMLDEYCRLYG